MAQYKVTETWSSFVTVEADSFEDAYLAGKEFIHAGKMDDVEYCGSDEDGVINLETDEFIELANIEEDE